MSTTKPHRPESGDTTDRLAAIHTTKSLEEITADLPNDRRQLLREMTGQGAATLAAEIGQAMAALERSRNTSLREAQANVSLSNAAAALQIVERLAGRDGLKRVYKAARITDPVEQHRYKTGDGAASLADFNRLMYSAWIEIGRPDAIAIFAANMKLCDWGPVEALANALQEGQSIYRSIVSAKHAVQMFNRTKWIEVVYRLRGQALRTAVGRDFDTASGNHWDGVIIQSGIFDSIMPIDDVLSRWFVWLIVSDATTIRWGRYLRTDVGTDYRSILEEFREARLESPKFITQEIRRPTSLSGATMSEGIWQWWIDRHSEIQHKHGLPYKLRARIRERHLQFPLIQSLDWYRRLAERVNWPPPVRNVYEKDGIVWGTFHGEERQIAHRLSIIETKVNGRRCITTIPWDPEADLRETCLVIDQTIPWCTSAEAAQMLVVCEEGQLWETPFSEWEATWQNPRDDSLSVAFKRTAGTILDVLLRPKKALAIARNFRTIFRDADHAVQTVERRYQAWYDETNAELDKAVRAFCKIGEATEGQLAEFRREWTEKFQEFSDTHTYGHVERVTDLLVLLPAWLGYIDQPRPDYEKFAAVLSPTMEKIPPAFFQDTRFSQIWDLSRQVLKAGLLHDGGKIIIPPEILSAPGRLSDEQAAIMKAHVEFSYIICLALYADKAHALVREIVRNHHENLDGTGYPRGLGPKEWAAMPATEKFTCLMIRIIDVYDAMRGPRDYRTPKSLPRLKVIQILLDDALRGKINGWLTAKFVKFVFWMRDHLREQNPTYLENLHISSKMIEFLSDTEIITEDTDAEITVLLELERRFPEPTLTLPWEL